MDVLTAELTPSRLAEVLQEPEKALLGRVLKTIGQERCAENPGRRAEHRRDWRHAHQIWCTPAHCWRCVLRAGKAPHQW